MSAASACAKVILFGEHAVVYGRPALAVPLSQLRARAFVETRREPGILIHARDLGREIVLGEVPLDDALAVITHSTLAKLGVEADLEISVESEIPLAAGFGSGAAISTALVRALAAHFGKSLSADETSALVFETEKLYHGTPSGIDNTVIAYEMGIRFLRGAPPSITTFMVSRPFTLVIANTGIPSSTKITVGDVRRGWEQDPARFNNLFDEIGAIVDEARVALAEGKNERLGELMARNQTALAAMGVSSPEIDRLLATGIRAGASGGKLSGGGRGGNVILIAEDADVERVTTALVEVGAKGVLATRIES